MSLDLYPLRVLLTALAGWMNRQRQDVIAYLAEENRVLKEQLKGRRLPLDDGQRRRRRRRSSGGQRRHLRGAPQRAAEARLGHDRRPIRLSPAAGSRPHALRQRKVAEAKKRRARLLELIGRLEKINKKRHAAIKFLEDVQQASASTSTAITALEVAIAIQEASRRAAFEELERMAASGSDAARLVIARIKKKNDYDKYKQGQIEPSQRLGRLLSEAADAVVEQLIPSWERDAKAESPTGILTREQIDAITARTRRFNEDFERITELSDIVSRTTRKIPVLENQLEIQRHALSRMTEGEKRRDRARDAVTRVVATEILALGTMDLHAELAQLAGKSDARWDQRLAQLEASIEWANEIGRFGVLALGGIERDRFHQPGITNDEETWIYTADLMRGAMQAQVRPDFDRLDEKGARKPIEALVKHRDIVTRGLEAIDLEQANRKRSASIAFGIAGAAALGIAALPALGLGGALTLKGVGGVAAAGAKNFVGGALVSAGFEGFQLAVGEHDTGRFEWSNVAHGGAAGVLLGPVGGRLARTRIGQSALAAAGLAIAGDEVSRGKTKTALLTAAFAGIPAGLALKRPPTTVGVETVPSLPPPRLWIYTTKSKGRIGDTVWGGGAGRAWATPYGPRLVGRRRDCEHAPSGLAHRSTPQVRLR